MLKTIKTRKNNLLIRRAVLLLAILAVVASWTVRANQNQLPDGFAYVTDVIPTAILEVRYFSEDNFVGAVVDGYHAPKAILTQEAAEALKKAADILYEQGYYIKIFDAYRPQRAVDHFIRWAKDLDDTKMKGKYYPDLDKSVLFELGYIAEKSGHSRGSTVDLTLVDIATGEELDMGSGFDFFGEISNHGTDLITEEQERNRNILRDAMVAAGFEVYPEEWWHYKLKYEPYPDTYFDFPVKQNDKCMRKAVKLLKPSICFSWTISISDVYDLRLAVMSWMWGKFNEDWTNQYEVIESLPR